MSMPRCARVDVGEEIYHVINRAVARLQIFSVPEDYQLFETLLEDTVDLTGMRVLGYTIMPNHWHLVLYPRVDGDLSLFMHRLTNMHTRKVHTKSDTTGFGPLYQGRYKSFLVESENYLFTLLKYVERNPVRACLVQSCEAWQWGSAWRRTHGTSKQRKLLDTRSFPLPDDYALWVNTFDTEDDLLNMRRAVNKGIPYGRDNWVKTMVKAYNLESTLHAPGRRKEKIL